MKGSLRVGTIAGIGVFIHWTFVLIIFYLNFTSARASHDIQWSVLFVLSIFATVLLHELGHALAAKRYGIGTKDITLLPIGGVARLERFPEKPGQELVVAIAGPAVNIVLALITALITSFPDMHEMDEFLAPGVNPDNFLVNFFFVNLWLALFNMIPAFPMDGGRVLRALLSFRLQRHVATRIAALTGQVIAVLFVVGGFFINPFLVLIGIFIDLVLPMVPEATGWPVGLAYYGVAIGLAGLATGMYIGAGLGSGPRDGLMLGLSALRGWPVRDCVFDPDDYITITVRQTAAE